MKSKNIDVSIIIVNYNTRQLLINCLTSIQERTLGINYEIIVVDNNSSDNSLEEVRKRFKSVNIFNSGSNLGFGKANNLGIKIASGRNIFFLNSDTLLINNAVKILSDYLDKNEKIGICGGNLFNNELKEANSFCRIMPGIFSEINVMSLTKISKLIYGRNSSFNYTSNPLNVAYITGADMMVPKRILDIVGGFDPDFFLYYEETELTNRVKKAGYLVNSLPQAKIIHLEGASSKNISWKTDVYNRSRKIYYKKVYTNRILYVIAMSLFKTNCKLAMLKAIISRNKNDYRYWKNLSH